MDKETKKEFRNHVPEVKFNEVKLTEDELEEAVCQKAQLEARVQSLKLNLEHLKLDEENKYSERMSVLNARKNLEDLGKKIKMELKTSELNLKVFKDQVKNGVRKEMIEQEDSEVEVEETTEGDVEESVEDLE